MACIYRHRRSVGRVRRRSLHHLAVGSRLTSARAVRGIGLRLRSHAAGQQSIYGIALRCSGDHRLVLRGRDCDHSPWEIQQPEMVVGRANVTGSLPASGCRDRQSGEETDLRLPC